MSENESVLVALQQSRWYGEVEEWKTELGRQQKNEFGCLSPGGASYTGTECRSLDDGFGHADRTWSPTETEENIKRDTV